MEFMIVMIAFFVISYIVSVANGVKDIELTSQWREWSEERNEPVYWDYAKKSYIDRETGLSVQESFWKDEDGEYFHYWMTKPDMFGHQKFVRARYFKESKWNESVRVPDWILNCGR